MKAMVLLTDAYGGSGGIAKFNRDLLEALSTDGRFHTLLALPRLRPERHWPDLPSGLDYRVPKHESRLGYGVTSILAGLRNRPLNLLLCAHIRLLPVARLCSRISGAKLALVVHGIDAWKSPGPRFERWMKSVDLVLSVSRYTAQQLVDWSRIDPECCHILPNSINLEQFSPGRPPQELVDRFELAGRKVLLTVGRLDSRERTKGIDETIEVLARLRSRIPEVAYLIVGDGDDRPRLERLAQRSGVSDRVVFAGYVTEADKVSCYRLADIYVMPSRSEGFGIVYLEALACGLPVIGGQHGGGTEVLAGMERAMTIPPGDCDALEIAVPQMLQLGPGPIPGKLRDYGSDRFRQSLRHCLDQLLTPPR